MNNDLISACFVLSSAGDLTSCIRPAAPQRQKICCHRSSSSDSKCGSPFLADLANFSTVSVCNSLLVALLRWSVAADEVNWYVGLNWPRYALILSGVKKCWPICGVKQSHQGSVVLSLPH